MTRRRRLLGVYARVGRIYRAWGRSLVVLATIVFVPLGLVDALLNQVQAVDTDAQVGAFLAATLASIAGGLFGEIFFSGAVAISLTHPEHEGPPTLREVAGHISYGKLIAVDLLFVLFVALGLIAAIVGSFVVLVYFSLTGSVVELEKHSIRGGFRRSFQLVRGHFWMVAAVVVPIEIVGDAVNEGIVKLAHLGLGHGLPAAWLGEAVGNIVTAPFFSIAVVLLTLDLIHHRDGNAPRLKHQPAPIPVPEAA